MTEMRKITAFVPAGLLKSAQAYTGAGVTETLRQALEGLAYRRFYEGLRSLRGKVDLSDFDLERLREDREFDENGNVIN
jgi:hypothetical protein